MALICISSVTSHLSGLKLKPGPTHALVSAGVVVTWVCIEDKDVYCCRGRCDTLLLALDRPRTADAAMQVPCDEDLEQFSQGPRVSPDVILCG